MRVWYHIIATHVQQYRYSFMYHIPGIRYFRIYQVYTKQQQKEMLVMKMLLALNAECRLRNATITAYSLYGLHSVYMHTAVCDESMIWDDMVLYDTIGTTSKKYVMMVMY